MILGYDATADADPLVEHVRAQFARSMEHCAARYERPESRLRRGLLGDLSLNCDRTLTRRMQATYDAVQAVLQQVRTGAERPPLPVSVLTAIPAAPRARAGVVAGQA